ncbi:MAG: YfcE family phosphodiesterase [Clostridia bacterium]|nr:YfcE family phosphodiesterase [Clostridia bacterium]
MTRIGVISDTHGSYAAIAACVKAAGAVDGWFHLGDYASDAKRLAQMTGLPVFSVLGNCDGFLPAACVEDSFDSKQKLISSERVVAVERARIFLCHGHHYDVDMGSWTLSYRAEELSAAAALYGHTHRPSLSAYGSVLLLNPGSPTFPRGMTKPGFAVLEVDGKDVNARLVTLGE